MRFLPAAIPYKSNTIPYALQGSDLKQEVHSMFSHPNLRWNPLHHAPSTTQEVIDGNQYTCKQKWSYLVSFTQHSSFVSS